MSSIGKIIHMMRTHLGMSRAELAEGICSDKFIYLIEKEERNPSARMISQLGERMGTDLFSYFEYADCQEPFRVKEVMDAFNYCRREGELLEMDRITQAAKALADFQTVPWSYEIRVNELSSMLFIQYRIAETLQAGEAFISDVEQAYPDPLYLAHVYTTMAIACQIAGDIPHAVELTERADQLLKGKERIKRYEHAAGSLWITRIALFNLTGELDRVIAEGARMPLFQDNLSMQSRFYHIDFNVAYAHYRKGEEDTGIDLFLKGLYLILAKDKNVEITHLLSQDIFHRILADGRIPEVLRASFKRKYRLL